MWAIGTGCPEFRVRTPAGAVGPREFRPSWLGLLHCTRPCTPGCRACLAGFERLGRSLATRGCRLVVALDQPDAELRARLGRLPADREAAVLIGTWETPEPAHAPGTLFAVIDPEGLVREVLHGSGAAPLPEAALLAAVDRALGRRPAPIAPAPSVAEGFGCVDWFDYGAAQRPAPDPR